MSWDNTKIMGLIPFKVPNSFDTSLPHIGYAVSDEARTVPDVLFLFGGVNPAGEHLLAASPMMYQGLSRIAGAMRRMIDEIEQAVNDGHVARQNVAYVIANYEAIENDCLTLMGVAVDGVDTIVKGLGGKDAKR